jgi:hypothetical protein
MWFGADCHHEARAWRIVHSNWLPLSSLKNDSTEKLKTLHLRVLPDPTSGSPCLVWKLKLFICIFIKQISFFKNSHMNCVLHFIMI